MDNTAAGIERFYREEFGRILATLIRVLGDFDLAEDAAQDAFASAVEQWHRDGLPDNPRASDRRRSAAQGDRSYPQTGSIQRSPRGIDPHGREWRRRGRDRRGGRASG